jgi:hypothetical protein
MQITREIMQFFEATEQEKKLATVGREMMEYSEEYGKIYGLKAVTDEGLRQLNELSYVGAKLTRFGVPFGTKSGDFSESDLQLIAKWGKKEVDIERK